MQITGHTRIGALLGSPVAHSISPMMYNDSFHELNIDQVYLCFEATMDTLPDMVHALRQMNAFGFNLTMPVKTAVVPLLDEVTREAQLIGAVNTVKNDHGRLVGYNTDGIGFLQSVRENGIDIVGRDIILLGAGGAASAIAIQAAFDGVDTLHLVCRHSASWGKAQALVDRINAHTSCKADLTDIRDLQTVQELMTHSILLINATSSGMAPHIDSSPLPDTLLFPKHLTISDVIYEPRQTRLLQNARQQGRNTFNGMYMLLHQGAAAFHIWTGEQMPVELIRSRYFAYHT